MIQPAMLVDPGVYVFAGDEPGSASSHVRDVTFSIVFGFHESILRGWAQDL